MQTPPPQRPAALLTQLRARLDGRVIAPDDAAYDDARALFYTGLSRRPAAIVRPTDTAEVVEVVRFARESGAPLAVRSGGHSVAGHSSIEGGLVLDLSQMRAIDIDVAGRTAWAEAGLTAAAFTEAAGAHGLAVGFGDAGSVGIAGITLGGGMGFLSRRHGLTVDSLLAAEVVTADGEVLRVDEEHHPDLFWAIRGGGGNFGVVTRFHFALHEVDQVVAGLLVLPATPDVIAGFVAAAQAAPDELSTIANVAVAPPLPFLPEAVHGELVLLSLMVHAGDVDEGERVIEPFRALAPALVDTIAPTHYPAIYEGPEPPHPAAMSAQTMFVDDVDRARAETILERLATATAPMAVVHLRVLGGAVARVPDGATAYAHRQRPIMVNVGAMYEQIEDAPVHAAWVADTAAALSDGHAAAYVNFLTDDREARVRDAYPDGTWERLAAVKAHYDPTNLFRSNHNIPPASGDPVDGAV